MTLEPEIHVHSRSNGDFAAVGLFVQWLAESVSNTTPRPFTIRVRYGTSPEVRLDVLFPRGEFGREWSLTQLRELHRVDDGRGAMLRTEIAGTVGDLREAL